MKHKSERMYKSLRKGREGEWITRMYVVKGG